MLADATYDDWLVCFGVCFGAPWQHG